MLAAVLVEVVVEFVDDLAELVDGIVHVAAVVGVAVAFGDELLDALLTVVEELLEGGDAFDGDEGGVAEGVDLLLAENVFRGLRVSWD